MVLLKRGVEKWGQSLGKIPVQLVQVRMMKMLRGAAR
jgi:hypothetical protein